MSAPAGAAGGTVPRSEALDVLRQIGAGSAADTLEPTLVQLSQSSSAGVGLVIGIVAALWSASVRASSSALRSSGFLTPHAFCSVRKNVPMKLSGSP